MISSSATALNANMLRHSGDKEDDQRTPFRRVRTDIATRTDIDLFKDCAKRDTAAMEEIVRRYQPKLQRFLGRLLNSPEDTEEAVIDVLVRVWQQCGRFEGRASVATWIYRIAANVAYDAQHRRKSRPQTTSFADDRVAVSSVIDAEDAAMKSLEHDERSAVLEQALSTLSVPDRTLLVLYYVEEMGYDEIRDITRCSYPVLKTRLMRARQRLRAAMEALAPEDIIL